MSSIWHSDGSIASNLVLVISSPVRAMMSIVDGGDPIVGLPLSSMLRGDSSPFSHLNTPGTVVDEAACLVQRPCTSGSPYLLFLSDYPSVSRCLGIYLSVFNKDIGGAYLVDDRGSAIAGVY